MNSSKNPNFPYCSTTRSYATTSVKLNFINVLKDVLQVPDQVACYNRLVVDGIEGVHVLSKRFAYPWLFATVICALDLLDL